MRFANTGIWDSATGYNNLNATVTVTGAVVVEYVVFDDATGDGKWSTAGNWQGGNLTIAPTAGLNVVQKIQKAVDADFASPVAVTASDLTIQASSAGQGALVSGIGGPGNIAPPDDGENY